MVMYGNTSIGFYHFYKGKQLLCPSVCLTGQHSFSKWVYVIESDFTHRDHSVSVLSLTLITGVPIRAVLCFVISFPFLSISVPTEIHDL